VTYSTEHEPSRGQVTGNSILRMTAGSLVLLFSLLPWVGINFGFGDITANAWAIGLTAWPAVLMCVAVAIGVAAPIFWAVQLPALGQFGPNYVMALVSAIAVTWLLIRTTTFVLESSPSGGSTRPGLFLALFAAITLLVSAIRAFKESGEASPSKRRI